MLLCAVSLLAHTVHADPTPSASAATSVVAEPELTEADKIIAAAVKEEMKGRKSNWGPMHSFVGDGLKAPKPYNETISPLNLGIYEEGDKFSKARFANRMMLQDLKALRGLARGHLTAYQHPASLASARTIGGDAATAALTGMYLDALVRGDRSLMHKIGAKFGALTRLNNTRFGRYIATHPWARQLAYGGSALGLQALASVAGGNRSIAEALARAVPPAVAMLVVRLV